MLGGGPTLGPNGLAVTEAKLAVLDGLPDIDTVMCAVEAVSAYVTGAIRREIANLRVERATGPVQARLAARLRPARDESVGHRPRSGADQGRA
ncbi:hypothetical protein [Micromonospora sp. URMC 103]|uniref:hypothetical protein n=1 Tax=Micromonospora sp. URMC 103 TaxID=3423406 RepID=UPI003F19E49B